MALAGVLTAVRELILDERQYPTTEQERLVFLTTRYPNLSLEEREDLAKIPPERLKLYTTSIFAGERNVLKGKFPISFKLLERAHLQQGKRFDALEFVRGVHQRRPWQSDKVGDLAANFASFLLDDSQGLLEEIPGFRDMVELEFASFGVPRALSDSVTPAHGVDLAGESALSLDKILEMSGFVPSYVQGRNFQYNVTEVYRRYKGDRELLGNLVFESRPVFGIVSRTADYVTTWTDVSEGMFLTVNALPRSTSFSLATLAESFLERLPAGKSEEDAAKGFLVDLLQLSAAGALVVMREHSIL